MTTRQHLVAQTELAKSLMKLSLEERRKEIIRRTYVELRKMEMERRQRVALETLEKCEWESKERNKEAESLRRQSEEERMEEKHKKQLKEERLQWKKVMLAEEVKGPEYTVSALKKERESSQEEVELCYLLTAGDKAHLEGLVSARMRKKPLYNNWVVGKNTDSDTFKENCHTKSSVYLLFAAREHTSEGKPKTSTHKEIVQWMQDRWRVGHSGDKREDDDKHKLQSEATCNEDQLQDWTCERATF